ncbi:hypothetical protein LEP1GSC109_0980 [Leptospira interrogans str. UI 13372]|nr:hypothetical protein LEP1GSC089_0992 [Leptospira interrogans serovar Autumnalis str. LP101]EMN70347.1 hypothetical protein LEP1GSC100_1455 [Leptospira interrogans serovar Bataviae str. UI 08561]EMN81323.1 hypothetical protein LEP1GSC106_2566 [Leptospira interrogans serovar Grippotyphosa str. UI 12764]EMO00814.1 hypothetical protein LEP1GSC112_0384 [Leptospira interrogans serovar Pomona str. UT364]EMO92212.1 hypothetical protein LEP1GSC109_0980 [Leptospira interrogans str. UI 13372]
MVSSPSSDSQIHSCKQYTLTYDNLWKEYFGDQFENKIS